MVRGTVRRVAWCMFAGLVGAVAWSTWVVEDHRWSVSDGGGSVAGGAIASTSRSMAPAAESDAKEVFREVVAARDAATAEALKVAPPRRGGFLVGPTRSRGAEEKRALVASRYMARAKQHIATSRGMTVREVEDIYARGRLEGWPER